MASTPCTRCEVLPAPEEPRGVLFLRFPLGHSQGKALRALRRHAVAFDELEGGVRVRIDSGESLSAVLSAIDELSTLEQEGGRAVLARSGEQPTLEDVFNAGSLASFAARARSGWLIRMIAERRLVTAFQPILDAADGTTVFAHECLLRGMDDGVQVPPDRLFGVARRADLLFQLDLAARQSAIRAAAAHRLQGKFFVNFTPASIYDPAFCLRATVRTLEELGVRPEDVVFEVVESDRVEDVQHLLGILDFYRQAGFQVALDDVGSGYSSLNLLHALKPDFLKLDMQLIRGVDADPYKAVIAEQLLGAARRLGMRTIAEGVETEAEYAWLRARGADFVQGFLFARPSLDLHVPLRAAV